MTNDAIKAAAQKMGFSVRPTRTGKNYVFFVRKNNVLLFDKNSLSRNEVQEWLKTQEKS